LSFTGELLLIEKTNGITKPQHWPWASKKYTDFSLAGIIALLSLLLVFIFLTYHNLTGISLYALNIIGLLLSGAYLLNEKGVKNIAFDYVCGAQQGKSACTSSNNILNLPLSFSELGAIYFIFNLVGLFLSGIAGSRGSFTLLYYGFVILSIIMVCLSLYIQLFQLKKFCRLCMVINAVLIIHASIVMSSAASVSLDIVGNLSQAIAGIIALGVVSMFSANLTLKNEKNTLIAKNNQIWSNRIVIDRFLIDNSEIVLPGSSSLILSNKNATTQIVLIMHLSCRYCEDAFGQLAHLVMMNKEACLQIFIKYEDSPYHEYMMYTFSAACDSNQILTALDLFSAWKIGKNTDNISENNKIYGKHAIEENDKFFQENKITTYPTIMINGKIVPSFIDFAHIKVAYA
jgi:hypothetical protein